MQNVFSHTHHPSIQLWNISPRETRMEKTKMDMAVIPRILFRALP